MNAATTERTCVKCGKGYVHELGPICRMSLPDGSGRDGEIHAMCWQAMFEETKHAFEVEHHQTPRDLTIAYYSTGVGRLTVQQEREAHARGELWEIAGSGRYVNLDGAIECENLGIELRKIPTTSQVAELARWEVAGIGGD